MLCCLRTITAMPYLLHQLNGVCGETWQHGVSGRAGVSWGTLGASGAGVSWGTLVGGPGARPLQAPGAPAVQQAAGTCRARPATGPPAHQACAARCRCAPGGWGPWEWCLLGGHGAAAAGPCARIPIGRARWTLRLLEGTGFRCCWANGGPVARVGVAYWVVAGPSAWVLLHQPGF